MHPKYLERIDSFLCILDFFLSVWEEGRAAFFAFLSFLTDLILDIAPRRIPNI